MIEQSPQMPSAAQPAILDTRNGMAAAFQSLPFRVLWFSEAVSLLGDRILMIALINLVYEQSGSAAAVGLLSMIKALPALLFGTLAGVFVDRWSRKWIMVFSNLAQFALVLAIPFMEGLPLIFAVYFVMAIISQFFIPARSAAIPNLVPAGALTAANALFAMAFVGAIAIGPAIGGYLSDTYGLDTAFFIDALTFLVPAVAVGFLAIPNARREKKALSLVSDWREGFTLLKAEPKFRNALLLLAIAAMLIATLSALGVMVVREKLSGSAADYGLMMSFAGLGMLSGALISTRLGSHFNRQRLAVTGVLLASFGMIGISLAPMLSLVKAAAFLLGMGIITVQIHTQTTLQSAPDALRGHMLGASQAVMGSMTFLIAGCAGLLAASVGTTLVLLSTGLLAAAAGAVVLLSSLHQNSNPF